VSDHKLCSSCGYTFENDFMVRDVRSGRWICTWCDSQEDGNALAFLREWDEDEDLTALL
jgi:hypothetical protein